MALLSAALTHGFHGNGTHGNSLGLLPGQMTIVTASQPESSCACSQRGQDAVWGRLSCLSLSLPTQDSAWSAVPQRATALAWTTSAGTWVLRRSPGWGQDQGAGQTRPLPCWQDLPSLGPIYTEAWAGPPSCRTLWEQVPAGCGGTISPQRRCEPCPCLWPFLLHILAALPGPG